MLIHTNQNATSRRLAKALAVLLILSLLAALLPTMASGAPLRAEEKKCSRYFEVNRNSTLKKIADAYGYTPAEIADANDMKSPYTIFVGQSLCIPSKKVSNIVHLALASVQGVRSQSDGEGEHRSVTIYPV